MDAGGRATQEQLPSLSNAPPVTGSDPHPLYLAIGTAGGALIGGLASGKPLTGAVIGAVAGTVGGWLYDRHMKSEGQ
jgi:uncharacterized membrane protein